MQAGWGSNLVLNHSRQNLNCALVGNYSVITGTVEEGEGEVEFLFFNDNGTPRETKDGKEFSLLILYFSKAIMTNLIC